jgi:hypothetical protein
MPLVLPLIVGTPLKDQTDREEHRSTLVDFAFTPPAAHHSHHLGLYLELVFVLRPAQAQEEYMFHLRDLTPELPDAVMWCDVMCRPSCSVYWRLRWQLPRRRFASRRILEHSFSLVL